MRRLPKFFVGSVGDPARSISGVSAPDAGTPDTAVFLGTSKALKAGLTGPAGVVVVSPKNKAQAEAVLGGRTLLLSPNVELAMAEVVQEFFLKTPYRPEPLKGVHPTAVVHATAEIAPDAVIGPHAYIGRGVKIAAGALIGAGAVVEDGTAIGPSTVLHPNVYVGHSCEIGARCEVNPNSVIGKEGFGYAHDEKGNHYRIPHQGRVVLEDDVHVGSCCVVDRGTFGESRLERGAKLDNHVHIGHNSRLGQNALVTAGFTMAGSSRVGRNFIAGGKTVVTGHIEVCDNVNLAALSAVGKAIDKPGQYGGNPLLPLQQFVKMKVGMTHLHELQKQVKRIMKHLKLESTPEESASE